MRYLIMHYDCRAALLMTFFVLWKSYAAANAVVSNHPLVRFCNYYCVEMNRQCVLIMANLKQAYNHLEV